MSAVEEYIELADLVLIMTVEPGFGGQKFMSNMMEKVRELRANNPGLDIEVDGGVGLQTVHDCAKVILIQFFIFYFNFLQAGANWIVAGTAVTGAEKPSNVIQELKTISSSYLQ